MLFSVSKIINKYHYIGESSYLKQGEEFLAVYETGDSYMCGWDHQFLIGLQEARCSNPHSYPTAPQMSHYAVVAIVFLKFL